MWHSEGVEHREVPAGGGGGGSTRNHGARRRGEHPIRAGDSGIPGRRERKRMKERSKRRQEIGGIITALITPFTSSEEVDEKALRKLVQFQLRKKVHGFFVCGTTGLGPLLTIDERKKVATAVVEETGGGAAVIVLVGMKDSSRDFHQLVETIERLPGDFLTVNGTEGYVLPAFLVGARGAVSALSNAIPEIFLGIYDSFRRGDFRDGLQLQRKLNRIRRITDRAPLSSVYEILRERGIECGNPRRPFRPMSRGEATRMLIDLKQLRAF